MLDIALPREGAIVGTPQYMAPEQFSGEAYAARTDQFSFCVALYKALYGRRPFEGKTFGELRENIVAGNLRPPPDSDVPAYIRDLVLRGLAMDPDKRWPSMDPIIDALARDPAARKKRIALAGAAVGRGGGIGSTTWRAVRREPGAMCRGGAKELAGGWDGARAKTIADAFAATGKSFAADAAASVTRGLDDYTKKWLAMQLEACEATRVKGTQSAELLDLRMTCLSRRLDSVRATVDLLAHADGDVASRAIDLVSQLPPIDPCADSEALRAAAKPPLDPKVAARVATAQRSLATVRALWIAARYSEAQTQLASLRTEANTLGWRPLEGEVLLQAARLADSTASYADALKLYRMPRSPPKRAAMTRPPLSRATASCGRPASVSAATTRRKSSLATRKRRSNDSVTAISCVRISIRRCPRSSRSKASSPKRSSAASASLHSARRRSAPVTRGSRPRSASWATSRTSSRTGTTRSRTTTARSPLPSRRSAPSTRPSPACASTSPPRCATRATMQTRSRSSCGRERSPRDR